MRGLSANEFLCSIVESPGSFSPVWYQKPVSMDYVMKVRTPNYQISYNGKNITADISGYVSSITYTDYLTGQSDSLDIELENTDGLWLEEYFPEKGASLVLSLGYMEEGMVTYDAFSVDEFTLSGPPSIVTIKALASGVDKDVRTRRNEKYEKTTLAGVVGEVASRCGMQLSGQIDALNIERVTQYGESDLGFLKRLADTYGYGLKVIDNNKELVFWNLGKMYPDGATKVLTPKDLSRWSFRDQITKVPEKVEVVTLDPNKKDFSKAESKSGANAVVPQGGAGPTHSADSKKIYRTGKEQPGTGAAQSLAAQQDRDAERTSASITLEGEPALRTGINVELREFGKIGGKYTIEQASHTLSRANGLVTTLELKKVNPSA